MNNQKRNIIIVVVMLVVAIVVGIILGIGVTNLKIPQIVNSNVSDNAKGSDYIFENSDKEEIFYNVNEYTKDELELAKNEIFARYGYDFESKNLEEYFSGKSWYIKIAGKKIAVTELNKYEQINITKLDGDIKKLNDIENTVSENIQIEDNASDDEYIKSDCKDINTVKVAPLQIDKSLVNAEILKDSDGKNYVKISNNYVVDKINEEYEGKFFKNQREILPKRVYLMDDTIKCYYHYNGLVYYIPVEKCNTKEEERIEYRDYGLTIYKSQYDVKIWDKIVDGYNSGRYDEDDKCWWNYEESFSNLYMARLNPEYQRAVYEIDLDGDLSTKEVVIPSYENYRSLTGFRDIVSVVSNANNNIKVYDMGRTLYGNIKNYRNVFYGSELPLHRYQVKYVNEHILFDYVIFDKEKGFDYIYKYANGDDWSCENDKTMEGKTKSTLTLDRDLCFVKLEDNSEHDYILYESKYDVSGDKEHIILPKGTKVHLVKFWGFYTECVVYGTEDGKTFVIVDSYNSYKNIIDND